MAGFLSNKRLAPSVYWLSAGGLIAFLCLVMGLDRYSTYTRSIEAEKRHLGELARIAEENISGRLRAIHLIFDQAVKIVSAPSSGEDEIVRALRDLASVLPEIRQIYVTDERGIVTFMSTPGFKGFDASGRAYFLEARNDPNPKRLNITGPIRAPTQEAPLILQTSRALVGQDGQWQGVIGASLEIGLFNEVMDSARPAEMNGSAALIDKNGIVMAASSNVRHIIGRDIGPDSAARTHVESGTLVSFHILRSPIDGIEKILVARTLDRASLSPLTFVTMSPTSQVLRLWKYESLFFLVTLAGISAAIIFLTLLLCRRNAESEARKRALTESEARMRRVIQTTHDGIWDWNIETGEDYLSPRWKEILGYRDDELPNVASSFFDLIHPDDKTAVEAAVRRHIEAGEPYRIEMRLRHKDGTYRWILSRGEAVRDAAGNAVRMVGSIADVTERKRTEGELKEAHDELERRIEDRTHDLTVAQERFQISQTFANIGTWDWNIVTGDLYWSERIGPLFGYGDREIETTYENFLAAIHPDDRQLVIDAVAACVEKGAEYNIEHRIVRADGVVRWLSEKGDVLRDGAGRPIRMLGVVQDITARKATEDHLRHAQKIESLGNLAGGVAHSLNNLLVPILALSKMTADGLPPNSPARAALEKVVEASGRAKDLVARVLAFSRQEAPRKAAVDLGTVVEDALRLARSSLPSAITLDSGIPDRPVPVLADAPQMETVVLNLVNNAVAAINGGGDGREGGHIAVRLAVCHLDPQKARRLGKPQGGPCARLTVADNGVGMTAATKARIFDPFFTTKKVGEGTGLGLSMAHGIVEEHGGMIEVESEPGQGTRFHIHLPLLAAGTQPQQKSA